MPGRNRAWADTVYSGLVIVDEGSLATDLLVNAPTVDTLTAVRIIIDVVVVLSPAIVSDALNVVSVGLGVTSREAFTAVALPDPAASTEYPPRGWLYVANKPVRSTATTVGLDVKEAHFQVDLRAMRKVDKGVLFLALGNAAVLNTLSVDITGRVRVLCLT